MGFFDAIGDAANRAKLTGEIALIDRDIVTRKKKFGVELYDVIDKHDKRKQKGESIMETPGMFKSIAKKIQEPVEKFSKDIRVLELQKRNVENDKELHGAMKARDGASVGVGKQVTDRATEAQHIVKIKYLNREILIKKEKFGLAVWDMVSEQQWMHEALINETKDKSGLGVVTGTVEGLARGIKGTAMKTLGAVSSDEREVSAVVNKAKENVRSMEEKKALKEAEVARIIRNASK
mmetsp:Transcript_25561/g.61464  ORF Transcript_25561/g.61464 Transcript_25561/m.61464 type:complete len:236 (+) Transcript_25561:106-813(+)